MFDNKLDIEMRCTELSRSVSLQTKNEAGTKIKDALITVVETAKKLKVSIWEYLLDRIDNKFKLTSLADLIRQKNKFSSFSN